MGVGAIVTLWNVARSVARGPLADANPWGADTLEWDMPSPPPPYATTHIPTVVSRYPLWDRYDERADPDGVRRLDRERLTLATTAIATTPVGVAKMPEDTAAPLGLALAILGVAIAFLFHWLALAAAAAILALWATGAWLWPEPERVL
jgi:hypothetical protein